MHRHPVTSALLGFVGAGKRGLDIVANYTGGSFGWPKDAVDAGLAVLMVSGHLSARIQEQPVKLAELDQRKIGQADFRVQHPVLTAVQKLRIKKLFQDAGHKFQPGDEATAAVGFVQVLKQLAQNAGGEPPAPAAPQAPAVIALNGLMGNDLLFELFEKADELTKHIAHWKAVSAKISLRLPAFQQTEELLGFALGLEGMEEATATLASIRSNRSLLDDPDPTSHVMKTLAASLRIALRNACDRYADIMKQEQAKLDAHPAWNILPKTKQTSLLQNVGVVEKTCQATETEDELLAALKSCNLATWQTLTDALPTRYELALAAAIKETEPKAARISLPSATIHDQAELNDWLDKARAEIKAALDNGPVIV